ncbi:hypothetical protein LINGRAHAP2_LOCUS5201 [Linum grandiflorum]
MIVFTRLFYIYIPSMRFQDCLGIHLMIFDSYLAFLQLNSFLTEIGMCVLRKPIVKETALRMPLPITGTLFPSVVGLIFPCLLRFWIVFVHT